MHKNLLLYIILSGILLFIFIGILISTSKIQCSIRKPLEKSSKTIVLEKIPVISTLNTEADVPLSNMSHEDFQILMPNTNIDKSTSLLPQWRYLVYRNYWLVKFSFFQEHPNEPGYTYTYMYCFNKKLQLIDKILVHSKYDTDKGLNSYTEYQKTYIKNGYVFTEYIDVTLNKEKYQYLRAYKLNTKGKFEKVI